jgi:hypothetical protein
MPFGPDPQDAFTADEFKWNDAFLALPAPDQEKIKADAMAAIEERKKGGDILGAIKAGVGVLLPWVKK